jgi:hypothetical protein
LQDTFAHVVSVPLLGLTLVYINRPFSVDRFCKGKYPFFLPKYGEKNGKNTFFQTYGTCQIIRQTHPRRVSGEYAE